jgi:hypothetical protein
MKAKRSGISPDAVCAAWLDSRARHGRSCPVALGGRPFSLRQLCLSRRIADEPQGHVFILDSQHHDAKGCCFGGVNGELPFDRGQSRRPDGVVVCWPKQGERTNACRGTQTKTPHFTTPVAIPDSTDVRPWTPVSDATSRPPAPAPSMQQAPHVESSTCSSPAGCCRPLQQCRGLPSPMVSTALRSTRQESLEAAELALGRQRPTCPLLCASSCLPAGHCWA